MTEERQAIPMTVYKRNERQSLTVWHCPRCNFVHKTKREPCNVKKVKK